MDRLEKCPYCGEYPKIECYPLYLGLWHCHCLRKKCKGKPWTKGQHHNIINAVKEWNEIVRKVKNKKEEDE